MGKNSLRDVGVERQDFEICYQFSEVSLQQRLSGDKPGRQCFRCSIWGLKESLRAHSPYQQHIKKKKKNPSSLMKRKVKES